MSNYTIKSPTNKSRAKILLISLAVLNLRHVYIGGRCAYNPVMLLGALPIALLLLGIILLALSLLYFWGSCCEGDEEMMSLKRGKAAKILLTISLLSFSGFVFIPSQSQALILYDIPQILQNKKIPEPWQQLASQNLVMTAKTCDSSAFRNHSDSDND